MEKKMTLHEFINQNLKKNINNLTFHINEVQNDYENEPLFKMFIDDKSTKRELNIFSDTDLVSLSSIINFIGDVKLFHKKELNVNYIVTPLMPQYRFILEDKLKEGLLAHPQTINSHAIVEDINISKLEELTIEQQKNFFMDLCVYGNNKPIKKFIDFTLSDDVNVKNKLDKSDLLLGLKYAIIENNLNIVKEILDHDKINKIVNFFNKNEDLSEVFSFALKEDKKEILFYIMNDKQYQLSDREINDLRPDHPDVIEFMKDYGHKFSKSNKIKM